MMPNQPLNMAQTVYFMAKHAARLKWKQRISSQMKWSSRHFVQEKMLHVCSMCSNDKLDCGKVMCRFIQNIIISIPATPLEWRHIIDT